MVGGRETSPEGKLPILSSPNVGEHHQHPADEDDRCQTPRDRILPIDIFHPIFPQNRISCHYLTTFRGKYDCPLSLSYERETD